MAVRKYAAIAALSAGLGLSGLAGASPARGERAASGGILRIAARDVGFVDPTLGQDASLELATQLRLVGYPDREGPGSNRVIPEAAEALPTISRDRRTYLFTIRKGLRFSDGTPVTAAHFAFGLARAFRPEFESPAAFVLANIVGAESVIEGRAETLAGVRARGRTLTISLTRPQPALLVGLANEGQALPLRLPAAVPVTVPVPSAGPYYVKEWDPENRVLLVRNPYWNRRAIPWRPARLGAIEWTLGLDIEEGVRMVEQGTLDLISAYPGPPPANIRDLAARYGINKGRFFLKPGSTLWYVVFNSGRPLFRGNARLRRAVNFALDRPELARLFGAFTKRTDQILPPAVPGFEDADLYPLKGANAAKAGALARGSLRGGKAVMYNRTGQIGTLLAQVIRFNLAKIGLEVEVRTFEVPVMFDRMRTRGEPWDLSVVGQFSVSPGLLDPGWWIDFYAGPVRFEGDKLSADSNWALFDEPAWNRRIDQASRLTGEARYAAYGRLDQDLMREAAPVAPFFMGKRWTLVSPSVGCFTALPFGSVDLVALCKK
jgi:peptide/nickel transport system substrate-binding protein